MAKAMKTEVFEPVISRFCLMEVAIHFRDYQISRLLVKDGFGYRQFSRKRKEYTLPRRTELGIRALVREFEQNNLFSVVTVTGWNEKAYSDIELYVEGYVDLVDAFHLQAAVTAGCDYLVTGDEEFKQRVDKMVSIGKIRIPTKMIYLRDFLRLPEITQ